MLTDQMTALSAEETGRRIIVALDVPTAEKAREVVRVLGVRPAAYKIGLQLFVSAGPNFVRELTDGGIKIFLDLKFHDIPNTVARACIEAANLGVWMMNVHALGGSEMMKRAADALRDHCEKRRIEKPLLIGVSILTSADPTTMKEIGLQENIESQVDTLASLIHSSGLDGIVASAREAETIRKNIDNKEFTIVTPGIRPAFGTNDDQKRVTTVRTALASGSDYLVVGRPIIDAPDMLNAFEQLTTE